MDKITRLAALALLVVCSNNASASLMHDTDTAGDDSWTLDSHQRLTNRFSIDVDAIFAEIERSQWTPRGHSDVVKKKREKHWSSRWMGDEDIFTDQHLTRKMRHFKDKWHKPEGHHPKIDFRHHHGHIPVIPVPAAVWLFGSGLIGLIAFARKKA